MTGAIVVIALANIALVAWLPGYERRLTIAEETEKGHRMATQILMTRNHYIAAVVTPLRSDHDTRPGAGPANDPDLIPAPAQFALDVSDVSHERETVVSIVGPDPAARQDDRAMDTFQQSAWSIFQTDPNRVLAVEQQINGKSVMRIAVADRMTNGTCPPCANPRLKLPARDAALGAVRAVLQIDRVIERQLRAASDSTDEIIFMVGLGSLLLSFALVVLERAFARRHDAHVTAEAKIHFLAFHDPMTGLLNRVRFNELFSELLLKHGARAETTALYLVDLDHFKTVNDLYGHAAGDDVIRIAADRLRAVAGPDDLVARIGGDEFVIAQARTATSEGSVRLAQTIVDSLAEPFVVGSRQFTLSASVGLRLCPAAVDDVADLFKSADRALYKAKQRGRNRYAVYDAELDRAVFERRLIENRLRAIVDDSHAFHILYQPLCDVRFGEVTGFEALMRLTNGSEPSISADVFIPIAEDLGLMPQIGAHMLTRALEFAVSLPDPLTIAINVSPRQFFVADPALSIVDVTRRALEQSGFPAHRLELEITEGLFLQSTDDVMVQLRALKDLGVKLALDDFGVGFCSLGYISRFPVDKLKIDKSFLSDAIERPKQIVPILEAIASLGETLDLVVVAEGIETPAQAELAERVGCKQLQGFYFCRPIEEVDVAAYVLCNQIGTRSLMEAGTGEHDSFWSRLIWAETSGIWSPTIAHAS